MGDVPLITKLLVQWQWSLAALPSSTVSVKALMHSHCVFTALLVIRGGGRRLCKHRHAMTLSNDDTGKLRTEGCLMRLHKEAAPEEDLPYSTCPRRFYRKRLHEEAALLHCWGPTFHHFYPMQSC